MRYEVAGCSEQALRERNEDSHAVVDLAAGARLVLVADGLGGLRGGRTASRTAVSVLARRAAGWDPGAPDPELLQNLQEAFAEAHDALLRQGEKDPGLESCGTTLVAALLLPDRVLHSYTGDSRLYWFRAGRKLYQTRDHNLAQVLVEMGELAPDAAGRHPTSSVLSSCLGAGVPWLRVELSPRVEEARLEVQPGDVLVLCTDGLHGVVAEEELGALLAEPEPAGYLAEALVDLALESGAEDNVTAVVVKVL